MAKSAFASQNAQNTTFPEPFWKFRCSKMPRGCGEKHICKSKCTKLHIPGAILEVATFQNATRLWRKAHLQVKMHKTPHFRSHFGSCDVQKLHAAVARSIFVSQMWKTPHSRATFGSSDVQKWHAAVGRSTFARQNVLNACVLQHFASLRFFNESWFLMFEKWHAPVARSTFARLTN